MGSPWKSYFASTLGNFGNAIISNLNIISTYSHILDVDDAEPRGVIGVTLNHPILKLVFNTHLDHINENVRMKQLEELFSALESHTNVPHIIMGDFNALSKEDYSQDYFDRYVYSVRFRNGWELPKFDVIDFIKGKGYVDCWRQLNPDAKDRSTCRFGTRIDYIFASASLVPLIDWTKSSCEIYHDSSNASDHEPVILTLFFNNNYNNNNDNNNNNNNHVLSQPTANIEQTN
jgi:endonuclease/exonuclease/phosphatase family metal-dependent hydrolase